MTETRVAVLPAVHVTLGGPDDDFVRIEEEFGLTADGHHIVVRRRVWLKKGMDFIVVKGVAGDDGAA